VICMALNLRFRSSRQIEFWERQTLSCELMSVLMVVLILLVVSLARNPGTEPPQFGHDRCSAGQYSAANALKLPRES
jgi:hypothetical protein